MNLKIKFIPYENLKMDRFNSLFKDLEKNTIILIDAKLRAQEEAELIEKTMTKISDSFSGIEISSMDMGNRNKRFSEKLKNRLIEVFFGKKRGITVVGPAKIVRKIKKNPEDLLLYM